MKYKVGDRVRVIGNDNCGIPHAEWEEIKGNVYTITKAYADYYELNEEHGYSYHREMLEPAPFGKSDLQTGMRVRYRTGDVRIVLKTDSEMVFAWFNGLYLRGDGHNEDLTDNEGDTDFDIMEVLKPSSLSDALKEDCDLISIWKREEEFIEVTIAEIAEWKGVSPERIRIKGA